MQLSSFTEEFVKCIKLSCIVQQKYSTTVNCMQVKYKNTHIKILISNLSYISKESANAKICVLTTVRPDNNGEI